MERRARCLKQPPYYNYNTWRRLPLPKTKRCCLIVEQRIERGLEFEFNFELER